VKDAYDMYESRHCRDSWTSSNERDAKLLYYGAPSKVTNDERDSLCSAVNGSYMQRKVTITVTTDENNTRSEHLMHVVGTI
jgi:hypothetical protein